VGNDSKGGDASKKFLETKVVQIIHHRPVLSLGSPWEKQGTLKQSKY